MGKTRAKPVSNIKTWAMSQKDITVPKEAFVDLYQAAKYLGKRTRRQIGLVMRIPVFIQDPLVAREKPGLGVQEIEVRLEAGLGDGPTSSRIAVVDYDGDHQRLLEPVRYDEEYGLFTTPGGGSLPEIFDLPDLPDPKKFKDKDEYAATLKKYNDEYQQPYRDSINEIIKSPYFHQINVWAVVQRVLELYESSWALGRPVPWGFDGNRLLVVPHAGYGENAFYDQSSKSLQFYYYGDEDNPCYTCLSHDIIAHETGHAILDGIRPLYNENPSLETAAFHEFIGDLTALLLALDNKDIRYQVENLRDNNFLSSIAEEFGQEVDDRPYLRSASNKLKMDDPEITESLSAHTVSQVLTGAMFDILVGIAQKLLDTPALEDGSQPAGNGKSPSARKYTTKQALWKATEKFRRVALQPLDLCPPCDIQFIDYARAVIRNDMLTNPVDAEGYRQVMMQVFHERKLCTCNYKPDAKLPAECEFQQAIIHPRLENLAHHDMERVSRSPTAAYYFLHDNRRQLRIPLNQDITIAGLYDNAKLGELAERLPRQVVIQYTWKEQLVFEGKVFRELEGKKVDMYCGGTLVFDDRGNLLSWFRKPGAQPLEKEAKKLKPVQVADMEAGKKRKQATLKLYQRWFKGNRLSLLDESSRGMPRELLRPMTAVEKNGILHFSTTPHLRKEDRDLEASKWKTDF